MKRVLAGHRVSLAVAIAALMLAATGGAFAASAGGTVSACVKKHGGALYEAKHCARGDRKLSWNKLGPQGASGAAGPPGAQGPGARPIDTLVAHSSSSSFASIGNFGPINLSLSCQDFSTTTVEYLQASSTASGWSDLGSYVISGASNGVPTELTNDLTSAPQQVFAIDGTAGEEFITTLELYFYNGSSVYNVSLIIDSGNTGGACKVIGTATPAS